MPAEEFRAGGGTSPRVIAVREHYLSVPIACQDFLDSLLPGELQILLNEASGQFGYQNIGRQLRAFPTYSDFNGPGVNLHEGEFSPNPAANDVPALVSIAYFTRCQWQKLSAHSHHSLAGYEVARRLLEIIHTKASLCLPIAVSCVKPDIALPFRQEFLQIVLSEDSIQALG